MALFLGPRDPRSGTGTALKIGLLGGFAAAFPINLSVATWIAASRFVPFWWMVDLWMGAILAALVAGWVYRINAQASVGCWPPVLRVMGVLARRTGPRTCMAP